MRQVVATGRGHRGVFGRCVFVDVVAEKDHQVGRLGRHVAPGGIKTVLPALAGREHKPQSVGQCVGSRSRAGSAGFTDGTAQQKPIEVPAPRLQALHLHMHRVAQLRQCAGATRGHDAPETLVVGDLPAQLHAGQRRRQGGRCDAAPQHHSVFRRCAAGDAQRERVGQCAFAGPCV